MNPDLTSQLNSSNLSNTDIQNLLKALGQTSLGKKGSKLTPQDRNNLLSKMTSSENSAEYLVEKEDPTKNMTEEEKKQYHREELRKKLREKQGKFKESRCSKVLLQKKYNEQLNKIQYLNIAQYRVVKILFIEYKAKLFCLKIPNPPPSYPISWFEG